MLLITSCKMYEYKQRAIRNSWLSLVVNLNLNYFFIVADPDQEEEFIIKKDILSVKCGDGYIDLPHKLYLAFKFVHLNYPNLGVLKIDDDCYVNPKLLINFLENPPRVHYTGGKLVLDNRAKKDIRQSSLNKQYKKYCKYDLFPDGKQTQLVLTSVNNKYIIKYTGGWFDGGNGYWLSQTALHCIVTHYSHYTDIKDIYEDKCWADVLRQHKISGISSPTDPPCKGFFKERVSLFPNKNFIITNYKWDT